MEGRSSPGSFFDTPRIQTSIRFLHLRNLSFFNVFSFNGVSSVSRETRKLAERDPWRILETPPKLEPSTPSNPITFRSTVFFSRRAMSSGKQEVADEVSSFERWRVLRDLTCEEIPRDMTQSSRDNHVHK